MVFGEFSQVDDEEYDWLMKWEWQLVCVMRKERNLLEGLMITESLYSCTKNCGRSGTFIEMILSKKVTI